VRKELFIIETRDKRGGEGKKRRGYLGLVSSRGRG
jgi:hypothetical protein